MVLRRIATLVTLVLSVSVASGLPVSPSHAVFSKLTFDGKLTLNGQPAAGQPIMVIAGPDLMTMAQCGRTTTDADGHYTMSVSSDHACIDDGNDGGPVTFIFTWHGQQVGRFTTHHNPNVGSFETIIQNLRIVIPNNIYDLDFLPIAITSFSPDEDEEQLVARRYYGTVTVRGAAPQGTVWVTVKIGNVTCGRARVHGGKFVLDITPDPDCASKRSDSGWERIDLVFLVNDRNTWRTTTHIKLDEPITLGKAKATPPFRADWLDF
ncbi:MAG: hypothetical protein AAF563_16140 [Pseudomonadota bacterium]